MRRISWIACGSIVCVSLAMGACGSDGDDDDDDGGSGGSGGTDMGGSDTGGSDTGGTSSGGMGGTGEGGSLGGMGGYVPSDHHICDEIPSLSMGGDSGFMIDSPDFENCEPLSEEHSCDGRAFGAGTLPELYWTAGPEGTRSYALTFKDISILADDDEATARFAYHWVIWDIPAETLGLPAALESGHLPSSVDGARQWSTWNDHGYLGPCPNLPPDHPSFPNALFNDSYSFTLYALPDETLTDLPAQPTPEGSDAAAGNWTWTMDEYLESIALAVTEVRVTSDAWADSFTPGPPPLFPCADGLEADDCLEAPD